MILAPFKWTMYKLEWLVVNFVNGKFQHSYMMLNY